MILLTGATGYVGSLLLDRLLQSGNKVICLTRNPQALEKKKGLKIIKADLENADVLSNIDDLKELQDVTIVIHLAALYDLTSSMSKCYVANVVATMNLSSLCRKLPNIQQFIHTSTVAVTGNHSGPIDSEILDYDQTYPNAYAKTKSQAEGFVRRSIAKEMLCILRPGIIIGNSRDMSNFKPDGPYMAISYAQKIIKKFPIFKKSPFVVLPINRSSVFPLVTVDSVVDSILYAVDSKLLGCHHIVMPSAPTILEFANEMFKTLGLIANIKTVSASNRLLKLVKKLPLGEELPRELLDYMVISPVYSKTMDQGLLNILNNVTWSEIKSPFFREATKI